MPKFTEQEKEIIQEKLMVEGERLFATIGLRKVTIDDLSNSVGISHSAFYAFYKSKEQLFMEINIRNQRTIYEQLKDLIESNLSLPPKELAKLYVSRLQKEFFADPIISLVNSELLELITRKVSSEMMAQNDLLDAQATHELSLAGVNFKYPYEYVVKLTQAVFVGISCFEPDNNRDKLAEILIDALIDKLVE